MARDPELLVHQEWLGYLQPVGLVVSPPALKAAQAVPDRNIAAKQDLFDERWVADAPLPGGGTAPAVTDLPGLLRDPDLFGWEAGDILGAPDADPVPDSLEVHLEAFEETLRPTYAVPVFTKDPAAPRSYQILSIEEPIGTDLDRPGALDARRWQASPQARLERLLRETGVPTGLLSNGTHLRLVYSPRGENSGHLTFPVKAMTEVAGRPILAALLMLLEAPRLFMGEDKRQLPAILAESRRMQGQVSTALAGQVLEALYELLRGFQAADDHLSGALLRETLATHPDHVYKGLLTVLLRLVTLLYAEDRGLISTDPVYVNHYSAHGLFERLREDAGHWPDTMDQRYGAWAQLLVLFRLMHDGGGHGGLRIPPRRGRLFDPDRFPFLEGRSPVREWMNPSPMRSSDVGAGLIPARTIPPVPDGTIFRVLEKLLVLDGETLSYRTLDVEQIGSVYTGVMGFTLRTATGRSIAVKAKKTKRDAAPVTVDLDALLAVKTDQRAARLREWTDQEVTGEALKALKNAKTPDDLVAALDRKVARAVTPAIIPSGSMILQPTNERRRTGSEYTPRFFTEPIVREALRPILARLGENPTPEAILALKICDLAVGSGAFLVETGRQLGDALVAAWHAHGALPAIPPDEDEHLHARRLIAQRCLYGVDRNQLAVDLAKLSLWLATLAKDHPFTFLDHNLRCGDSLVGLSREQIASFTWEAGTQQRAIRSYLEEHLREVEKSRAAILAAGEEVGEEELRRMLAKAEQALADVRLVGDLVIAAFFAADKPKARAEVLQRIGTLVMSRLADKKGLDDLRNDANSLRSGEHPVVPFHWEIEFPEVFDRENPGFDGIVGNPPFLGGRNITASYGERYSGLLLAMQPEISGGADLVAHFYRRAFTLLRSSGTFGLIATNTIAQGDTRQSGLRWICTHGGTIYRAVRRLKWPGEAAVVVSVVHVAKVGQGPASVVLSLRTPVRARETLCAAAPPPIRATPAAAADAQTTVMNGPFELDGRPVPLITAYLFHAGGHENPAVLRANAGKSFQGSIVLGGGFTFDDSNPDATPLAVMKNLVLKDSKNAARIFPYIGGEDINSSPTTTFQRYVINFGAMLEGTAKQWPDLWQLIESKVRPERMSKSADVRRAPWWQYWRPRPELYHSIEELDFVLVTVLHTSHFGFRLWPSRCVFSHGLALIASDSIALFCILQSHSHEEWSRFFGSSLGDALRYTPSDCFETFPFPACLLDRYVAESSSSGRTGGAKGKRERLEAAGREYYDFRSALMVKNDEGLTKTYNRFHDPEETSPDILRLRELHTAMDRAVLDAYGWTDIDTKCEFLLDYEEEDDEAEEGRARRRKKPWRYRWPDATRDEVLARLLDRNRQRAEEERQHLGEAQLAADNVPDEHKPKLKGRARPRMGSSDSGQSNLF